MDLKGSARDNNARVARYLTNAGAQVPAKYADGGAVGKKPATTIQINIGGQKPGMDPMAMAAMAAAQKPPVVNPPPAPPAPPPGADPGMGGAPSGLPMGGPPMGGMPGMPGMKRGGAVNMKSGGKAKDGDKGKGASKKAWGGGMMGGWGKPAGPMRSAPMPAGGGRPGLGQAGTLVGQGQAPVSPAVSQIQQRASSPGVTQGSRLSDVIGQGSSVPMPFKKGGAKLARGGSAFSEAHNKGPDRTPKDGDQKYGTSLMGKMAKGGRATADPMDFGAMSGVGREEKIISQAKASKQTQPVKGTAAKAQRAKGRS